MMIFLENVAGHFNSRLKDCVNLKELHLIECESNEMFSNIYKIYGKR